MIHWYALSLPIIQKIVSYQKLNIMTKLTIHYNCGIISIMQALQHDSEGVGQFILYSIENFATINSFKQTFQ